MNELKQTDQNQLDSRQGHPLSDAWWKHLLDVFNGNPPHPRAYYEMPADGRFRATDPNRFKERGEPYDTSE